MSWTSRMFVQNIVLNNMIICPKYCFEKSDIFQKRCLQWLNDLTKILSWTNQKIIQNIVFDDLIILPKYCLEQIWCFIQNIILNNPSIYLRYCYGQSGICTEMISWTTRWFEQSDGLTKIIFQTNQWSV